MSRALNISILTESEHSAKQSAIANRNEAQLAQKFEKVDRGFLKPTYVTFDNIIYPGLERRHISVTTIRKFKSSSFKP